MPSRDDVRQDVKQKQTDLLPNHPTFYGEGERQERFLDDKKIKKQKTKQYIINKKKKTNN